MGKFPEPKRGLHTRRALRALVLGTAAFWLVACTATERVHGYVPEAEDVDAVVPGIDSISSLEATIGRPSASGMVREDAWYYVRTTVRHFTYNRPEVTDREVLAIRFDSDGVVSDLNRYGLEDGRVINLKSNTTVTHGQTLTALEQIFGNFGQLSAGQLFGDSN